VKGLSVRSAGDTKRLSAAGAEEPSPARQCRVDGVNDVSPAGDGRSSSLAALGMTLK
jgi:hypothetical protein